MREITKLELDKIVEIKKKYVQPKCPGCGQEMKLGYDYSQSRRGAFEAWYFCSQDGWNVWPVYDDNAYLACMKAYKAAIVRVKG